jgi:hypothetical protein
MQPNWAKIVGELIADHEIASRKQIEPLAARIAVLEARPVEAAALCVPPELAEQVKAAIHLLHESPPIVQRNALPLTASPLMPPRPSRIERNEDGGYTLIYDEARP